MESESCWSHPVFALEESCDCSIWNSKAGSGKVLCSFLLLPSFIIDWELLHLPVTVVKGIQNAMTYLTETNSQPFNQFIHLNPGVEKNNTFAATLSFKFHSAGMHPLDTFTRRSQEVTIIYNSDDIHSHNKLYSFLISTVILIQFK